MQAVARVALDSPLPNLDRLFDYSIPDDLLAIAKQGVRVRVKFGRSKKLLDGYIAELATGSDFKLADLTEVVSPVPVLPSNLYALCRAVADRQASTLGDVLSGAIARRFVAIEKKFTAEAKFADHKKRGSIAKLSAALAAPAFAQLADEPVPAWAASVLEKSFAALESGESAIIVVPDFRDIEVIRAAVAKSSHATALINYSTNQTGSKRYESYLQCLTEGAHLVVGSRSAIFAPLANLGLIAMFDDGDSNLQDQQSPYAHARDIALLRQQLENCDLFFTAHSRSCEVQRLVDMNYLSDETAQFKAPTVAFDDSDSRVPTLAWQTIREASATGAVLVQVAAKGTARTAYCQGCSTRSLCKSCKGPIWIDATGMPRCRWCNLQNLDYKCVSCGDHRIRQGFGGSTRTVTEFGKAFPGVALVESTGDKPMLVTSPGKKIVIATPGAEPSVEGGYAAVIILDANQVLLKDSLRATEEGVRVWANAIAKLSSTGRAVIAGLPQQLGQRFALWQQVEIARHELENRRELEFPPHIRLASIEGAIESITQVSDAIKIEGVQVLGPISLRGSNGEQNQRFVVKYPYNLGSEVAHAIKSAVMSLTAGATKTSESGRVSRAIRVRMDDPEVI